MYTCLFYSDYHTEFNLDKGNFSNLLLTWYEENKRDLPWRKSKDPYKIWLSEIILQQTRINQGLPYYVKFLEKYENVQAFARATETEILRIWQGLGYYSRARNMLKCAKLIVEKHHGIFPDNYHDLLKLPGIGPYTAAAISSISFDRTDPVLDGNVYRVLSRIFGISEDIQSASTKKIFRKLAAELLPDKNVGDYNQALMEFGALLCTPQNATCARCVFSTHCYANQHGKQAALPLNLKRNKNQIRYFHYLVIDHNNQIFMNKREKKDIWHGLFDFPLIESPHANIDFTQDKMTYYLSKNHLIKHDRHYKHMLTHQKIYATFYRSSLESFDVDLCIQLPDKGRFYSMEEIEKLPKPGLIDKYLKEE